MKTYSGKWARGLAIMLAAALPGFAIAQDSPQKPIRFIVPFPPGGATDGLARVLGEKMSEAWKQQVIIDNRGGAGGNIAADIAAKAPADGHTIIIVELSHAANLSLYSKLSYHPVKDFAPVSQVVAIHTSRGASIGAGEIREGTGGARAIAARQAELCFGRQRQLSRNVQILGREPHSAAR